MVQSLLHGVWCLVLWKGSGKLVEQHHPVEHSATLERVFVHAVQYSHYYACMAAEHLKYGQCDRGAESGILCNYN